MIDAEQLELEEIVAALAGRPFDLGSAVAAAATDGERRRPEEVLRALLRDGIDLDRSAKAAVAVATTPEELAVRLRAVCGLTGCQVEAVLTAAGVDCRTIGKLLERLS